MTTNPPPKKDPLESIQNVIDWVQNNLDSIDPEVLDDMVVTLRYASNFYITQLRIGKILEEEA